MYAGDWLRRVADGGRITRAVLCSVVPSLTAPTASFCRRGLGLEPLVVDAGTRTGMALRYDPPDALGPDRLVAALAARERFGAPVIVIDFGTATTVNAVDGAGAFVGGAIAAGLGTTAEALTAAGARLAAVDLRAGPPERVVGRNTVEALRSGAIHGHAGLVRGLLREIEAELTEAGGPPPTVVATGGWSGLMAPRVPRIDAREPRLLLEGLRLVADRNPPAEPAA